MALRGSPVPHWVNPSKAALPAFRMYPVEDLTTGVWGFSRTPSVDGLRGTMVMDPITGVAGIQPGIVATSLRVAMPPIGVLGIY